MRETIIILASGYVLCVLSMYIGVRLGRRQVIVRPDGTRADTAATRGRAPRIARQAGRPPRRPTTTPPPRGRRITLPGGRQRYL